MKEKFNLFWPKAVKGLKWFFFSFIWLFILMLVIDIVSKQIVLANKEFLYSTVINYTKGGKPATTHGNDLIHGFLAISYVVNKNVAFGIGIKNNPTATRVVYIIVSSLISAGIIYYYCRKYKKTGKFLKATLALIVSGAIGNMIDRIFFTPEMLAVGSYTPNNGVVDWINFYGIWSFNFNWADSCIVVGVIMLIVYLIVGEVKEYRMNKKLAKEAETNEKILSKQEQERLEADKKENE